MKEPDQYTLEQVMEMFKNSIVSTNTGYLFLDKVKKRGVGKKVTQAAQDKITSTNILVGGVRAGIAIATGAPAPAPLTSRSQEIRDEKKSKRSYKDLFLYEEHESKVAESGLEQKLIDQIPISDICENIQTIADKISRARGETFELNYYVQVEETDTLQEKLLSLKFLPEGKSIVEIGLNSDLEKEIRELQELLDKHPDQETITMTFERDRYDEQNMHLLGKQIIEERYSRVGIEDKIEVLYENYDELVYEGFVAMQAGLERMAREYSIPLNDKTHQEILEGLGARVETFSIREYVRDSESKYAADAIIDSVARDLNRPVIDPYNQSYFREPGEKPDLNSSFRVPHKSEYKRIEEYDERFRDRK